ncbi:MAG: hypothetical protein WC008_04880 [Bacilli bacterium]
MKKIVIFIILTLFIPLLYYTKINGDYSLKANKPPTSYTSFKYDSKDAFLSRLGIAPKDKYSLNDFNLIEDYEYFTNLNSYPDNLQGSCGFVSLSILLGYLDDTLDDGILGDEFNDPLYKTNNFLHDTLTSYQHYIDIPYTQITMASTAKHLEKTFFDYRQDYIDESIYSRLFVSSHDGPLFKDNPDLDSIRYFLDKNIPVIIMMRKFSYFILGSSKIYNSSWHEVVVYGYLDDMFLVHLGWKSHSQLAIINTYNIQSFITIGDVNKLLKK